MKKLLLAFTVLFMLLTVTAVQAQQTTGGAEIKLETESVDYGTIAKDSESLRELKFTNTGTQPLVISNVRGSCGCTVPTWPKEPIMPGQTSSIKVNYDTKRVGKFHKTITITSNAVNPSLVVNVQGDVLPEPAQEGNVPLKKSSMIEQAK